MKLFYDHPTQKYVEFSSPDDKFHLYRSWLDFALTHFPVVNSLGVYVRFRKTDPIISQKSMTLGRFRSKWQDTGDISVCVGKDTPRPEEEIRFTFFHEYGHFLQYDQNRYYNQPDKYLEDDADAFAATAICHWSTINRSGI